MPKIGYLLRCCIEAGALAPDTIAIAVVNEGQQCIGIVHRNDGVGQLDLNVIINHARNLPDSGPMSTTIFNNLAPGLTSAHVLSTSQQSSA